MASRPAQARGVADLQTGVPLELPQKLQGGAAKLGADAGMVDDGQAAIRADLVNHALAIGVRLNVAVGAYVQDVLAVG